MSNTKADKLESEIISLGGLSIHWHSGKFKKVINSDKKELSEINGYEITHAEYLESISIVVLRTDIAVYCLDDNMSIIPKEAIWKNYYYNVQTQSFYRQNMRGVWFDIEGVKVKSTIILKDEVLISLDSCVSRANAIFKEESIYCSPDRRIIQVGKIVLDEYLQPLTYHNERLTAIGTAHITLANGDSIQEVKIGINQSRFINTKNKSPLAFANTEIDSYRDRLMLGKYIVEVFSSNDEMVYIDSSTGLPFDIEYNRYTIVSDSHILLGDYDIVKLVTPDKSFIYNLDKKCPLRINAVDNEIILNAYPSKISIGDANLINVTTATRATVIRSNDLSQYISKSDKVDIEKIQQITGFEGVFAYAVVKEKKQLFSLSEEKLVTIDGDQILVVDGHFKNKLLNVVTALNGRSTLDLRYGLHKIRIAHSDNSRIIETKGEPYKIGSKVLQNVIIETLGGIAERVVNLNSEELETFGLPDSMTTYADGEIKSIFAGLAYMSINFEEEIRVGENIFLRAYFRSYDDELKAAIIEKNTGKPLHLDGKGHQLELVTDFVSHTIHNHYFLGNHRMIGAKTLKEDMKEEELLFSLDENSSWLPFYDGYLPIFKRIIEVETTGAWQYHLFELRESAKVKEYVAVEKNKPYRILVENTSEKRTIKIVESKEKVLKSPEEISMIKKIFVTDPGILVDV